jgi:hypothetical protein
MLKKMNWDDKVYYYQVTEYTSEAFMCKIYKKVMFIPVKIYEKLWIRRIGDNSAYYMAWNTVFDYEHSKLKA